MVVLPTIDFLDVLTGGEQGAITHAAVIYTRATLTAGAWYARRRWGR